MARRKQMSTLSLFAPLLAALFTEDHALDRLAASLAGIARPPSLDIFADRSLIGWLIMGALAGWLSGELTRGKGFGCLGNVLLGLIGAVVGGWLFQQLHIVAYGFIGSLAAATVGAVLVVSLARALSGH
jgi:uncharacterized membrane protein YeaQ/YmgE (transglycosylase-associated protein family)